MDTVHVRPVEPEIMLLDDQPVRNENGVVIEDRLDMCAHLDYMVVRTDRSDLGFGQGDTVILARPDAGRRIVLDGTTYRLVKPGDIVAVVED